MQEIINIGEKVDFDFLLHRDNCYELIKREGSDLELLPSVSIKWQGYLVFKNISYNIVGDRCTIHDKNLYQSQKKYFPVYEECDGVYKYTGKYRVKKIPTKESIEAAKAIFEEVMEYITENQLIEEVRQMIGTKIMIFIPKPTQLPLKKYNLREKYKIFVYEIGDVGYILVDCKKVATIKKKGEKVNVYLNVPSDCLENVVGKSGRNIKPLIRLVGVEKINVLPIID